MHALATERKLHTTRIYNVHKLWRVTVRTFLRSLTVELPTRIGGMGPFVPRGGERFSQEEG